MSVTADPQAHTQMAPADEPHTPAPGETLAAAPPRGFLATGWAKFSDNAIPSLVVAVIAGLVLYSFNETSDRITRLEDSVNDRLTAIDARFTKLEDNINDRFTAVDARFTKLEDDIKADFAAVDARFTKLEEGQYEIAQTLAVLVALFEAGNEVSATSVGPHKAGDADQQVQEPQRE